MNVSRLVGVCFGFLVGIIIVILFSKKANTNGKIKTEYDERQKVVRGQSFKYGYYTYIILLAIMMLTSMSGIEFPVENAVMYFALLSIGAIVTCVHSILNDAYMGLNNNIKSWIILLIVATIINYAASVAAWIDGRMIVDGKLSTPFINFLCGVMITIIGIVGFIKISGKNKESEE